MKNEDFKDTGWRKSIANDEGVVLVTALLMLAVLTLMGVAAMSIRNTEQSISANNEVSQHNFYAVEAVTLEGAAAIEQLSDAVLNDSTTFPLWLQPIGTAIDLEDSSVWPGGAFSPRGTTLTGAATDITPAGYTPNGTSAGDRIWSGAIDQGLASGSSVTYGSGSAGMTKQERIFDAYGIYDVKSGAGKTYHGKMMLVVGYKKQVDAP